MALTAKPQSTISYNTEAFITRKLDQLFKAHVITDYRWIKHEGEDGDKDHIHLFMIPNKRIDTASLREEFNEIPQGATEDDKALGCLPFRTSKVDHWIMYCLHDPDYLKAHQSDNDGDGKIPYEITDIHTPFPEQLTRDYKRALALRKTSSQDVIDRLVNQHQSVTQIMYETTVNPMQILAINQAVQIDRARREVEIQEQIKQDQIKMTKAAQLTGSVEVVEQMPQNRIEYENGILPEHVETYHLNYATGELVKDESKIRHIKEEEDVHGLWEGLEYDRRRKEHKHGK